MTGVLDSVLMTRLWGLPPTLGGFGCPGPCPQDNLITVPGRPGPPSCVPAVHADLQLLEALGHAHFIRRAPSFLQPEASAAPQQLSASCSPAPTPSSKLGSQTDTVDRAA